LHNIAKALTDEASDGSNSEGPFYKKGMTLGLGLQVLKTGIKVSEKPITVPPISGNGMESKEPSNRIFTPLPTNPSAYLSNFIIYIATIGDIFDGVDTTHNFNYFSLIYDWPKDVSTSNDLSMFNFNLIISLWNPFFFLHVIPTRITSLVL
jgi:zinc finger FYVE domain-containing protein 26